MLSVEISDETFEMPEDFSPEGYFAEYYGITTDDTPMAHVVIRAYGHVPNYLRTLPLHASQKEIEHTDEYTDFSYDIRPSVDFVLALISYSDGIVRRYVIVFRHRLRDIQIKICNFAVKVARGDRSRESYNALRPRNRCEV
jgi:hypothetical protein